MQSIQYVIADEFHIHKRNFPSLFEYVKTSNIHVSSLIEKGSYQYSLINMHGNYASVLDVNDIEKCGAFLLHYYLFRSLSNKDLFDFSLHGINLFEVAKLEMLSLLMTKENWCETDVKPSTYFIFKKAIEENREELFLNMAAAAFWISTWMIKFNKIHSSRACFVFSGSYIYTKSLMDICRKTSTKCYVLESTFTGNDYFCEERYDAIPNNSNIRYASFREKLISEKCEDKSFVIEREIIKAKSKIVEMRNKNVCQPKVSSLPKFRDPSKKTILIAAQVVNDYSILVGNSSSLSSIYLYKHLIKELIEKTSFNIIVKTHPWERKKVNLKSSFTFSKLLNFSSSFSTEFADRILIIEDENLYNLFSVSDYFFTLCSQSALEAALEGFKPVIIGKSFYSEAGFTSDFESIDDFIESLSDGMCSPSLTLDEYRSFESFILAFFQGHTVSVHQSGISKLRKLFASKYTRIQQKRRLSKELEVCPKWAVS